MLVLKRKDRESITLTRGDEKLTLVLLEGKRGSATLGIDAGKDWKIIRIDNIATDQATGGTDAVLKQGEQA